MAANQRYAIITTRKQQYIIDFALRLENKLMVYVPGEKPGTLDFVMETILQPRLEILKLLSALDTERSAAIMAAKRQARLEAAKPSNIKRAKSPLWSSTSVASTPAAQAPKAAASSANKSKKAGRKSIW